MFSSVIPSQVITPAKNCARLFANTTVQVACLEPARRALSSPGKQRRNQLQGMCGQLPVSRVPYIGRLGKNAPAWSLCIAAQCYGFSKDPVFHCRGPSATLQAATFAKRGKARVVYDARGLASQEVLLRLMAKGQGNDAQLLSRSSETADRIHRQAVAAADCVTAVSQPLAEAIRQLPEAAGKPVEVIPCCVETLVDNAADRDRIRRSLKVNDDELLLLHVSTSAQWEDFVQVLSLFARIRQLRAAKLLFLTTLPPEKVTGTLLPEDPLRADVRLVRAAPHEVPLYLGAADIGLLLRQPHETHRMASPIKFSEYLSAGMAVAVSEGIGDTQQAVLQHGLGVVVPASPTESQLGLSAEQLCLYLSQQSASARQARIQQVCERLYLWSGQAETLSRLYGISPALNTVTLPSPLTMTRPTTSAVP